MFHVSLGRVSETGHCLNSLEMYINESILQRKPVLPAALLLTLSKRILCGTVSFLSYFDFFSPESNREAIGTARGVTPLLSLANSYDPRVQQNAVGAILNLTQSGTF